MKKKSKKKSATRGITPDRLRTLALAYFKQCDETMATVTLKDGSQVEVPSPDPYTISGLCLHVGFSNTRALKLLEAKPEFVEVVAFIRLKCEHNLELRLLKGSQPTGAIFSLKNHYGWTDRTILDHQSAGEKMKSMFIGVPQPVQPKIGS